MQTHAHTLNASHRIIWKANEKICMNVIWEYIKDHILLLSEDKYFLIASLKETLNKARSLV